MNGNNVLDNPAIRIGSKIKEVRNFVGMTQSTLASMSGVSRSAIAQYEIGNNVPPSDAAVKIAGALGVSLETLVGDNALDMTTIKMVSGPAFESSDDWKLFAAHAMQGLVSRSERATADDVARWAAQYADSMVREMGRRRQFPA